MKLYECVVEDNKDPDYLGRVKIRVLGVHSPKLDDIKTDDLPWSRCLHPLDQGNTFGTSTNVKIGTFGWCFSLNDTDTEFLFIGTSKGIFNEVTTTFDGSDVGFKDPNGKFPRRKGVADNPLMYGEKLNPDITRDRVRVDEFTEKDDTATDAKYPDNKVYEDYDGNIVEIDGTEGNPRIRIQHSSGARVEISKYGDITIQASNQGNLWVETPGLFALGADGNIIFEGDLKVVGSIESTGDISDKIGTLDSLRQQHDANVSTFNAHTHLYNPGSGSPTATIVPNSPETPDPKNKFVWSGSPL